MHRVEMCEIDIDGSDGSDDEQAASSANALLYSETDADVHFLCKMGQLNLEAPETIPAHKTILSHRSPVFEAMFGCGWAESNKDAHINIMDMTSDTFKHILQYLYTNTIDINANNVLEILYAARKYLLDNLIDECLELIDVHMEEVVCTDAFKDIDVETMCTIVKRDQLNIKEAVLYEAIVQWAEKECQYQGVEANEDNLMLILCRVVPFIRFTLMSYEELGNAMERCLSVSYELLGDLIASYTDENKKEQLPFNQNPRRRRKKILIFGGSCKGKLSRDVIEYNPSTGSKCLENVEMPVAKTNMGCCIYYGEKPVNGVPTRPPPKKLQLWEVQKGKSTENLAEKVDESFPPVVLLAGGMQEKVQEFGEEEEVYKTRLKTGRTYTSKRAILYNVNDKTFEPAPDMNEDRKYAISDLHGSNFYMFGGCDPTGKSGEYFDFTTRQWTKVTAEMPYSKTYGTGGAFGQTFFAFGGIDNHNYMLEFKVNPPFWKQTGYTPFNVQKSATCKFENGLVVSGGYWNHMMTKKVWRFDPKDRRFFAMPSLMQKRANHCMLEMEGKLVVIGGQGRRGKMLKTVEIFDGKSWKCAKDLHQPMNNFAAVVI